MKEFSQIGGAFANKAARSYTNPARTGNVSGPIIHCSLSYSRCVELFCAKRP